MKKKRRNITIYADGRTRIYTSLAIQVDNAGNEWLTPEQISFLEYTHVWARYEFSHQLKASKPLILSWALPPPEAKAEITSDVGDDLIKSTPAFSGVLA